MIDTASALARGLHLAATLSLLGIAWFAMWLPWAVPDAPSRLRWRLMRLGQTSGIVALLFGAAWLTLQGAVIANAANSADALAALPVVMLHTRFGHVMVVRAVLLIGATIWVSSRRKLSITLAGLAAISQPLVGHAGAVGGWGGAGQVGLEAVHLLAAGVWLGALLPLAMSLAALGRTEAISLCKWFSPVAAVCVVLVASTGLVAGLPQIGGIPGLVGTPYGRAASLRIALFLAALGLAGVLRRRLAETEPSTRSLPRWAVVAESCVGLGIVLAAGFMASAGPAVHTQPVWPFPWQFSLVTVNEDPDFRAEVVSSFIIIGAAALLLAVAVWLHRFRMTAAIIVAVTCLWRGPSFGLLLVEAYPTSFQTSPTGFAPASIVRGQALYPANCAECHGDSGAGDGPKAKTLRIEPADLTEPHLWSHADGELFWRLTHGYDDPEGGLAMPGFAASLSDDDRWALIDYIRARNAALAMQHDASLDVPVRAPAMAVTCTGLAAETMDDLRGLSVHLVAGTTSPIDVPDMVTVSLTADSPPLQGCVAADPDALTAYAVLAGVRADAMTATEFLIDPNGFIRGVHDAKTRGWLTRDQLTSAIQGICSSPINLASGGEYAHHH